MSKPLELDVVGSVPVCLKNPSFAAMGPLWVKNDKHPTIEPQQINTKKYQFIKVGKTFGFEVTRYLTIHNGFIFYYDGAGDKEFKGFCIMENLYVQWFRLKTGRYLLFLTNTSESSFFYFQSPIFWQECRGKLGDYMIQLNYKEHYQELQSIGKGSFSVVMKTKCLKTGKLFAAKVIHKKDKNKASTKSLVIEERRILRLINSKFVYSFEEMYEEENNYIVILEYLPGKDLMTLWKEKKITEPNILVPMLRMILEGIRDIHAVKVIHRDLKPQNILINLDTFKPSIIDFGLSLLLDEKVTTKSYKRCGTMGYMAPQVIQNSGEYKKPYNNKCDLFSFGIIAHMVLLGFNPVKGDSYDETYVKNKACEITINKAASGKWGQHCFIFLTKLLSRYPHFRYDTDQALKAQFFSQKFAVHDKQESSSTLEDKNKGYLLANK